MSIPRFVPSVLAGVVAGAAALPAQAAPVPEDPPPWWGVADNDTVSVAWNFDNAANPYAPTFVVAPRWFTGATVTPSANVSWISAVTNHQGVVGIQGAATATLDETVDNDPRPDWVKVFWMQYDLHVTASGTASAEIRQNLRSYARHNVRETSRSLGQGWVRVTLEATLAPQPDDETVDFQLMEIGTGTVAIDNLYTTSRCIDPEPDETGDGIGGTTTTRIDVGAATNNNDCFGAARTLVGGQERFWVTGRGLRTGAPHVLYSFDGNGRLLATINQPTAVGQPSATGMLDLAVVPTAGGPFLYGGQDGRGGVPTLYAYDVVNGRFDPARTLAISGLPAGTVPRALAFDPDGATGAGTFWLSDLGGAAYEVDLAGNVLQSIPTGAVGVAGAGYDAVLGRLYWFGRGGSSDPRNVQVVGSESSAYGFRPTGVRFFGDLSVTPAAGGSPGGVAGGMEFYRLPNGEGRMVCLADAASDTLYVLHAPFRFGFSCTGWIGMSGGAPYLGNAGWALTLDGVPGASFALPFYGFSNTMNAGRNLPIPLGSFGIPECSLLVEIGSTLGFVPVTAAGDAVHPVPLPTNPSLSYVDVYWQWLVLDPSSPAGFAMSDGGKTVLY